MQSSTLRIVLYTLLCVFILAIIGAYIAIWFSAKERIEAALQPKESNVFSEISYKSSVTGFPFRYVITISDFKVVKNPDTENPLHKHKSPLRALTGSETNYKSVQFVGDTIISADVFGKSLHVTLPKEFHIETKNSPSELRFNTPPQMNITYDLRNYEFIRASLNWNTHLKTKNVLKRLREFHYIDNGMVLGTAFDKRTQSYDSSELLVKVTPEYAQKKLFATLRLDVKNAYTKPGYYTWAVSVADQTPPMDELTKEMASLALDYPFYDGPTSYSLDVEGHSPILGEKPKENNLVFVNLKNFRVEDGRGSAVHQGNISAYKEAKKPVIYGNYALKVEQFDAVFSNYLAFTQQMIDSLRDHQEQFAELKNKKLSMARNAYILDTSLPLVKRQTMAFLHEIKALDSEGSLILDIEKEKAQKEPVINGLPMSFVLKSLMINAHPVLERLELAKAENLEKETE